MNHRDGDDQSESDAIERDAQTLLPQPSEQNKQRDDAVSLNSRHNRSFVCGFAMGLAMGLVVISLSILASSDKESTEEAAVVRHDEPLQSLVFMNQTKGYKLLLQDSGQDDRNFGYSQHYFLLQQGFEAQTNQAYCGVASVVTVLNSLRLQVSLPVDEEYDPYPYATQEDIFNRCVRNKVVYHDDEFNGIFAAPYGMGMGQIGALLQCYLPSQTWSVALYHVDSSNVTVETVRKVLSDALQSSNQRILVNFLRSVIHEEGGGHWSPIASYAPHRDAFLVLDVAKYKYPAVWVPTALLYQAMATIDECSVWGFPDAQMDLPDNLLYPENWDDWTEAYKCLDCQALPRGFVIVKKRTS